MLVDVSITSNNGQRVQAAVSWFVDDELHTDAEVVLTRYRGVPEPTYVFEYKSMPETLQESVWGELLEELLVQREENERLN